MAMAPASPAAARRRPSVGAAGLPASTREANRRNNDIDVPAPTGSEQRAESSPAQPANSSASACSTRLLLPSTSPGGLCSSARRPGHRQPFGAQDGRRRGGSRRSRRLRHGWRSPSCYSPGSPRPADTERRDSYEVFERFTDRARRVMVLAQETARVRGDVEISPVHILIGVATEPNGVGHQALHDAGITPERITASLRDPQPGAPVGSPPFTAGAKKTLELSVPRSHTTGHRRHHHRPPPACPAHPRAPRHRAAPRAAHRHRRAPPRHHRAARRRQRRAPRPRGRPRPIISAPGAPPGPRCDHRTRRRRPTPRGRARPSTLPPT